MAAPALRRGRSGKFTPASLRDYLRYQISTKDGVDREQYAFAVLEEMLQTDAPGWTRSQIKAAAEGLRLGMNEGVR